MNRANVEGIELAYSTAGDRDAPAVLLIHASPLSSAMWAGQVQALEQDCYVINCDLKGFGRSEAPDDPSLYSMAFYGRELLGLLDACKVERVAVVGLSIGGYIAFELLRTAPERIARVVLADTRAEQDSPEGLARRSEQQERARAEGLGRLADELTAALLSKSAEVRRPQIVRQVRSWIAETPVAGFVGALEAMKTRPDSTGDLAAVNVPALVLVGEDDGITPPSSARLLHEHLSGSQLVVLPEAGHLSNLDRPEDFNRAVVSFLAGA